ncbi:Fertility inhibition protein [Escherichia coli]|nr:Fertility inhibition protein [Escherichia coli]
MTEQKRPVLTLNGGKRKGDACPQPENYHQCHHATKVEGEKAKLAEKQPGKQSWRQKAQARQALSIYLNLPSLDEAVNTLNRWPGLFDGDTPRLLACGIRDVLLEDVAQRNIPLA